MTTYGVVCPKCGAEPNARCRTLTTNRTTDTHEARIDAAFAARRVRLPQVPTTCVCGNSFDGDNLCMISACEQEM